MMYEVVCVVLSGLTFLWVLPVSIPDSVALIETLLEELPSSVVFGPELPSNDDYRTQPSLFWVVPPQLVSEGTCNGPKATTAIF